VPEVGGQTVAADIAEEAVPVAVDTAVEAAEAPVVDTAAVVVAAGNRVPEPENKRGIHRSPAFVIRNLYKKP